MTKLEKRCPEELIHDLAIQNIKCPICNGEVNRKWFWDMIGGFAYFICECWSGDIYKDNPRHIFKVGIEVPEETVYIRKSEEHDFISR